MIKTSQHKLCEHLKKELKIESDALVWLHSSIKGFGLLEGGIEIISNAFHKVLHKGALVIPTFSYSWAKGEVYDRKRTECKDMGYFANNVWKNSEFTRNNNPNFSISCLDNSKGKQILKSLLCPETAHTCFGKGSVFDNMYKISKTRPSYIILLGGAHDDVVFRTTFLHYVEQSVTVPYRYLKIFTSPTRKSTSVDQYVRFLSRSEYIDINGNKPPNEYIFPIKEKYNKLGIDLVNDKLIKFYPLGYSETRKVPIYKFCNWLSDKIINNKEYLLN